jgi:DNA repair ATPase RecN
MFPTLIFDEIDQGIRRRRLGSSWVREVVRLARKHM